MVDHNSSTGTSHTSPRSVNDGRSDFDSRTLAPDLEVMASHLSIQLREVVSKEIHKGFADFLKEFIRVEKQRASPEKSKGTVRPKIKGHGNSTDSGQAAKEHKQSHANVKSNTKAPRSVRLQEDKPSRKVGKSKKTSHQNAADKLGNESDASSPRVYDEAREALDISDLKDAGGSRSDMTSSTPITAHDSASVAISAHEEAWGEYRRIRDERGEYRMLEDPATRHRSRLSGISHRNADITILKSKQVALLKKEAIQRSQTAMTIGPVHSMAANRGHSTKAIAFQHTEPQQSKTASASTSAAEMNRFLHLDSLSGILADRFSTLLAMLSCINLAILTEALCRFDIDKPPLGIIIGELILSVAFTAEITSQLYIHGLGFFQGRAMPSTALASYFEILVLLSYYLDLVFLQSDDALRFPYILLRLLRCIRMLVILWRNVHLFPEFLHFFMASLINSIESLTVAICMVIVIIFVFATFFTQVVIYFKMHNEEEYAADFKLEKYYSTLATTTLTLFQAISGGRDWGDVLDPLSDNISVHMNWIFALYIICVLFAVQNVITGVYVQNATGQANKAKEDKMMMLVRNFLAMSNQYSEGDTEMITQTEFQKYIDSKWMNDFFAFIDVDNSDPDSLFQLLDLNSDGQLPTDEFLEGCMRLRGSARAMDLQRIHQEVRQIHKMVRETHRP